jgi:hypothetical protein
VRPSAPGEWLMRPSAPGERLVRPSAPGERLVQPLALERRRLFLRSSPCPSSRASKAVRIAFFRRLAALRASVRSFCSRRLTADDRMYAWYRLPPSMSFASTRTCWPFSLNNTRVFFSGTRTSPTKRPSLATASKRFFTVSSRVACSIKMLRRRLPIPLPTASVLPNLSNTLGRRPTPPQGSPLSS